MTILIIILLLLLIFFTVLHFRKRTIISKVKGLNAEEKETILEHFIKPFGYSYDPRQDVFVSRQDAPQKMFGYTSFYDHSAPYLNMVFDYERIYFDYDNRTWLIQMWKGQYGITSGCELGIYYADEIIPPEKYDSTIFKAAEENDMLLITLKFNRHTTKEQNCCDRLGQIRTYHWWPTIFKMGMFSKPDKLFTNISIRFKNCTMLNSFVKSFAQTRPSTFYKINGLTVYFTFSKSFRKYSVFRKILRHAALTSCHVLCNWFQFLTRDFCNSGDKLLYLYYYLPFCVRMIFRRKPKH